MTSKISDIELQSPFDPRSFWIYRILAAELVLAAVLIPATGFTLKLTSATVVPLWVLGLLLAAFLLRRFGHERLTGTMEATALVYSQGVITFFILFPMTALSRPFADAALGAIDKALGFDWPTYASLFAWHPRLQTVLVVFYRSFRWQPLIVTISLFATGREDRGWTFVLAGTIACLLTALIYPLAPALGTFWYFHADPAAFPLIRAPWQFGPIIRAIKGGGRVISAEYFTGMVSFPSYHAAGAAIFVWAMWPFKRVRPLIALLNVGLCGSALIVGGHYLSDVLAGLAVGITAAYLASQISRRGRDLAPSE